MIALNTIHHLRCEFGLAQLQDESVDCFVTSPPYGGLRRYNGFEWDFETVAAEMFRTLKPGGVICWNTGDQIIDGVAQLYPERQKIHFSEIGLLVWDTIFWKKHGVPCPTPNRYYSVIEPVFVLSKGKPNMLCLISDRVNISAGRRETTHNRTAREYRERSTRKPYITAETGRRTNVWEYPTLPNETNHPAVMNLRLAYDLIQSYTVENEVVCDPFAGSGTTFAAAARLNRRWIGFEISEEYVAAANRRLTDITNNLFSAI